MWPFVQTAYAMAPQAGGSGDFGSMLSGFLPIVLIFGIFWFIVILPQQRRAKAHRKMVENLKKGDEVYTDSGIFGTIQKVTDDSVTLEIAPKVSVRIQRARIADMAKEAKEPKAKEAKESKDKDAEPPAQAGDGDK